MEAITFSESKVSVYRLLSHGYGSSTVEYSPCFRSVGDFFGTIRIAMSKLEAQNTHFLVTGQPSEKLMHYSVIGRHQGDDTVPLSRDAPRKNRMDKLRDLLREIQLPWHMTPGHLDRMTHIQCTISKGTHLDCSGNPLSCLWMSFSLSASSPHASTHSSRSRLYLHYRLYP